MRLGEQRLDEFLEALASREATPGGGSAAALMAALGAALTAMVCRLTVGRKKFAAVETEMQSVLAQAEAMRASLQEAIEQDVTAFQAVMAAYGLDKADPARGAAVQRALHGAAEAPLACARLCAEVVALAEKAATHGNPKLASDAGVAALAGAAALRGSALNVYVNAAGIEDRGFAEGVLRDVEALVEKAQKRAEAVYAAVRAGLS